MAKYMLPRLRDLAHVARRRGASSRDPWTNLVTIFSKDWTNNRTWLISQKKCGDVLRAQVPFARLTSEDAVGPADRSAQHDSGVRGERRLLWRNRSLGVGEPKGASPAPDKVAPVALSEFHVDFGIVDGVTDDVAMKTVVRIGG